MKREQFIDMPEPAMIPPSNVVMVAILRKMPTRPSIEEISTTMLYARLLVEQQGIQKDIAEYFQRRDQFITAVMFLEQSIDAVRLSTRANPHLLDIPPHVHHWITNMAHRIVAGEKS